MADDQQETRRESTEVERETTIQTPGSDVTVTRETSVERESEQPREGNEGSGGSEDTRTGNDPNR